MIGRDDWMMRVLQWVTCETCRRHANGRCWEVVPPQPVDAGRRRQCMYHSERVGKGEG